jgi:hypothetical protein
MPVKTISLLAVAFGVFAALPAGATTISLNNVRLIDGAKDAAGLYVGPYQATLNNVAINVYCDDSSVNMPGGSNVVGGAYTTTGGFNGARFFQGSSASTQLVDYEQIFYLVNMLANTALSNGSARANIQDAIWGLTNGSGAPDQGIAAVTTLEAQARSNYSTAGLNYSAFTVVNDTDTSHGSLTTQEMIYITGSTNGNTGTPEPGTILLMAAGVGCLVAGRRKFVRS